MPRKQHSVSILIFLICLMGIQVAQASSEDAFPLYECIKPNVAFWTKVYTEYSTSQGLMHDSVNLAIIYEVLDLKPYDKPGSRKYNRKRIKAAKLKYQKHLRALARNPKASDPESRRIAQLHGNPTDGKIYSKAAGRLRCQIGQNDRFRAGLIRSGAYIDQIKAIFKSQGVPEALAYLPHVESSFNPEAYSKFGAAGMWQFTRSTGKRFMQVGYELDERRDPIESAWAAAKLLKENHSKLKNWPMAVTAYNHGASGMLRAKRKHGNYPAIFTSYRSRIFKFASRNFYSEFMAAQTIAKDYQTYFGDLVLDKPNPTRSIGLDGYVAFSDICDHFGISAKELKTLNPALRTPVFKGQKYIPKGYNLRLPASSLLLANASITYDNLPESMYHEKQKPSRFYTVQRGDTAGKIARLHGVPLSDLILANNLNRRATIYRHQTLRIPVPGETIKTGPVPLTLASAPTTKASSKTQVTPAAHTEKETPEKEQYPKPVLASIIPPPEPGTKVDSETKAVDTPSDIEPSLEIVTADVQFENLIQAEELPMGILSVEVEETLGHYAEWADVRTWKIRRLNNLSYGDVLHLHQKVKIPLNKKTAEDFVQRRYEYHKRLQEDFFAVYRIGELQSYTVRRGDNYWTLCRDKFDVPLWLLKHCNPETDLANLRFNQKLRFPIIEKASENDPSSIPDNESDEDAEDQIPDPSDSLDVLALKNTKLQTYP